MKSIYILLVEDNEGDVLLIKEAFEEAKILNKISTVNDGEKAIRFLDKAGPFEGEETPDLILLDLNLPRKNGHEVLRYIKENGSLKHIPVIMLTTSFADKDIMESYKNYTNCYITKPVETIDILNTISRIERFWVQVVQLPPGGQE